MENAAKALLIAGGVLIAILLLTLFSYLNMKMASGTSKIYSILSESEITEFNQQFLNYKDRGNVVFGYKDVEKNEPIYNQLTVQDIATLINLAQNSNKIKRYPTKITITGEDNVVKYFTDSNSETWLRDMKNSDQEYKCTDVHINSQTLLVDSLKIEQFKS